MIKKLHRVTSGITPGWRYRSQALVAIYRYVVEHLKVGVGYNFTDFSDDLTDLSYDHQGVFLNMVGTM